MTATNTASSGVFIVMMLVTAATVLILFASPAEARRRNPLAESAAFVQKEQQQQQQHEGRRLMDEPETKTESETKTTHNFSNGDGKTTSALLRDAVQGTRSVAGKNVIVPEAKSGDDHLVFDLPLLDSSMDFHGRHWAGLLPVNSQKDGYLFYWLFAPDWKKVEAIRAADPNMIPDNTDIPLLIWLNGGPACSSMDGLWIENGPFRLNPGDDPRADWEKITVDPHSWNGAPAYTLYIDQPVGTGLSFTTTAQYPTNDEEVNRDFYYFLTEFMKLHAKTLNVVPKTIEGKGKEISVLQRPFYFSGESHAGHYIPSMMNYIRKKNMDVQNLQDTNGVFMPLSGAAIGNGWFDPVYQYAAHEAAYGWGLVGKAQERYLAQQEEHCREDLANKRYTSKKCFGLVDAVTSNGLGTTNPNTISQYDTRVWEDRKKTRDFPKGHHDVESYLGQLKPVPNAPITAVLKSIHALPSWESGQRYRECTDPPYYALSHQDGLGVVPDIVELLEYDPADLAKIGHPFQAAQQGRIRLLFFNGIHDLICNHVGNENALENLPWNNNDGYVRAQRYGWQGQSMKEGNIGGYMKEFRNLMFLKVLNAGHMVPMDVPEVALDMMTTFLYKKSFQTYEQRINAVGLDAGAAANAVAPEHSAKCPTCPDCTTTDCSTCATLSPALPKFDENECTSRQCQKHYDLVPSKAVGIGFGDNSTPSYVTGIITGAGTFVVLGIFVWCCNKWFCGRRQKRNFVNSGTIEFANGNGFKDDNEEEVGFVGGLFRDE